MFSKARCSAKCFQSRRTHVVVVNESSTLGTGESELASVRYLVELAESFLKVIREDLRGNEELPDVHAFSAGPSPHEDCLAEDAFVDDARGGVLDTDRVKQGRQEEVQWCRGMGVWEPVLRKDMDAEGAKSVSLRWGDTDKGDADRPNYRSRLVVREIKKAM